VDASLRRLRTDILDVCTLHRADPDVPIEDTVGALAESVHLGKVRLLGVSEINCEELVRAHTVHPIAVLESEYSLWTRDPEAEVIPRCAELGIAFVAFSPLGRGLSAVRTSTVAFEPGDFRTSLPRFQAGNLEKNLLLAQQLAALADRKNCSSSQLALAWVLRAGDHVFAIPGTRSARHLEQNMLALDIHFDQEDIDELETIFVPGAVAGDRYSRASVFNPMLPT